MRISAFRVLNLIGDPLPNKRIKANMDCHRHTTVDGRHFFLSNLYLKRGIGYVNVMHGLTTP